MIHDNFDGSNWCVGCNGPCQLSGSDKTATELTRWIFEQAALRGEKSFSMVITATLKAAGVNVDYFMRRARETTIGQQHPLIERRAATQQKSTNPKEKPNVREIESSRTDGQGH